jgi:hypothetical protein
MAESEQPLMFSAPPGDEATAAGGNDPEWLIRKALQEDPCKAAKLLFPPLLRAAVAAMQSGLLYSAHSCRGPGGDVFCDFWAHRFFEQVETSFRAYLFRMVRNGHFNYIQRGPAETFRRGTLGNLCG